MKTLTKLALAAVILTTTLAAQAGYVNGYSRNDGAYVGGHYRTKANSTTYDNLSYRGYPSQQPGYVSASGYAPRSYGISGSSSTYGNTTYHNYYGSNGGTVTGTTRTYGNRSYTTINSW